MADIQADTEEQGSQHRADAPSTSGTPSTPNERKTQFVHNFPHALGMVGSAHRVPCRVNHHVTPHGRAVVNSRDWVPRFTVRIDPPVRAYRCPHEAPGFPNKRSYIARTDLKQSVDAEILGGQTNLHACIMVTNEPVSKHALLSEGDVILLLVADGESPHANHTKIPRFCPPKHTNLCFRSTSVGACEYLCMLDFHPYSILD